MNESEQRMYEQHKSYIMTGRVVNYIYLCFSVATVAGVGGGLASEALHILPRLANIAIIGVSGVSVPESIHGFVMGRKWLKDADVKMENFEIEHGIKPPRDSGSL